MIRLYAIYLIAYVLPIFSIGCGNSKEKLVTLQKQVKDSLHKVDLRYSSNLLVRSIIMKDSFEKKNPDWRRFNLLDNAVMLDTLNYKIQDTEMRRLSHLHFLLKDQYDSLEFEIKKY